MSFSHMPLLYASIACCPGLYHSTYCFVLKFCLLFLSLGHELLGLTHDLTFNRHLIQFEINLNSLYHVYKSWSLDKHEN